MNSCMIGPSDIPLEDKTVTICYGTDMVNVEFVNFVCASREVATVRINMITSGNGQYVFFIPQVDDIFCACWVIFYALVVVYWLFSKLTFSNILIRVSNGLDPGQNRCSVGSDLDPNYLQRLSADDKSPTVHHMVHCEVTQHFACLVVLHAILSSAFFVLIFFLPPTKNKKKNSGIPSDWHKNTCILLLYENNLIGTNGT